jgi:hypothetical protein
MEQYPVPFDEPFTTLDCFETENPSFRTEPWWHEPSTLALARVTFPRKTEQVHALHRRFRS